MLFVLAAVPGWVLWMQC